MEEQKVNLYIREASDEEKTESMTCNWCKEPHAVEPSYKDAFVERTSSKLEALKKAHPEAEAISIDEAWTCGKCMLAMMGKPVDYARTDCHEHDVPAESTIGGQVRSMEDMM